MGASYIHPELSCIEKLKKTEERNMKLIVNYKRLKSLASCFTDEFLQSIPFGMNAEESASTGL